MTNEDGTDYPPVTRKLVAEAAKQLDRIIQGKTSDPHNDLTEAGWLLAGAIEVLTEPASDHPQGDTPPPPPASAAPHTGHAMPSVTLPA